MIAFSWWIDEPLIRGCSNPTDEDLAQLAKSISQRARKLYSVTDETIYDCYGETTILASS